MSELDFAQLASNAKVVSSLPPRTRGGAPNPFAKLVLESLHTENIEEKGREIGPVSAVREGNTSSPLEKLASKVSSAGQVLDRQYKDQGGVLVTVRKNIAPGGETGTVSFLATWRDASLAQGNGATPAATPDTTEAASTDDSSAKSDSSSSSGRRRRGSE